MTDFITMAHGNGGATMQELIRDYFVEAFDCLLYTSIQTF